MGRQLFVAAFFAATAFTPAAALAQEDAGALAAEIAAMRAKIESLEAKVKELEAGQPKAAAAVPSWKGAPQFEDKESGWSFKPRGRLQFDAAHVGSPAGIADRGLGFSNELRRGRLGAEGTVPGGFGYRVELDFADNDAEFTDAYLSYQATKGLGLILGQHNSFQSLEELTSSLFTSFVERAAFTDAFGFERRVGLSGTYAAGDLIASAGVFTDNIGDLVDDENKAWSFDGRLVLAPKLGPTQLHFGGSAHFRDNGRVAERGITTRYRQRPFVHTADTRFIGTPALRVGEETSYGLEAAMIQGPLHASGELHWLNADTLTAGLAPTFFGGYAELGWFITGETRGYRSGRFDRTKVLRPISEGGAGAFQINLRYDHLDLNSGGIIGGKQAGYLASLIWIPQDHVRFLLNYGYLRYEDALIAAPGGDRDYGINVFGARAQVDF